MSAPASHSSKTSKASKTSKTSKAPKASSAGKKTSKQPTSAGQSSARKMASVSSIAANRTSKARFIAGAAIVAAALLAISWGMIGYHRSARVDRPAATISSMYHVTSQNRAVTKTALSYKPLTHVLQAQGSTMTIAVFENSGTQSVNAVQAAITYPADRLQITGVKSNSIFNQVAATDTATPGLIRIARAAIGQKAGVTGYNPVVTIEFKVLQSTDIASVLTIDNAASLLVRSSDNQNILGQPSTALQLKQ